MCEEKRIKICLIKAGNVANSPARPSILSGAGGGAMGKFSNEKSAGSCGQVNFKLFNLCKRFFKGFS